MHPLPEGRGNRVKQQRQGKSKRARGREEWAAQEERGGRESSRYKVIKKGKTFINCTVLRQYGNRKNATCISKV